MGWHDRRLRDVSPVVHRVIGIALFVAILVPPAQAQDIKVTLLGTGCPTPVMDRFGPSTLVDAGGQKLLFDAGRSVVLSGDTRASENLIRYARGVDVLIHEVVAPDTF